MNIKAILEDVGTNDEGDDDPVPLPNVNAAVLKISFSGAPTIRILLLRMMRTRKSDRMTSLFGIKKSCKLTKEHFSS